MPRRSPTGRLTPQSRETDVVGRSRVELPDGRALAFRGDHVVRFNLFQAQLHARRGSRTRREAVADLYRNDDGLWRIGDPSKELDLLSDLAAAVLFSAAALEGLGNAGDWTLSDGAVQVRRLRDELVHPRGVLDNAVVFGRLLRGDADTCAEDAIAVVRAVRPDLLPTELA